MLLFHNQIRLYSKRKLRYNNPGPGGAQTYNLTWELLRVECPMEEIVGSGAGVSRKMRQVSVKVIDGPHFKRSLL